MSDHIDKAAQEVIDARIQALERQVEVAREALSLIVKAEPVHATGSSIARAALGQMDSGGERA